ncbi:hypothetical protein B0T18DRAFT_395950 [Schizothecium vesticola]|uniref:HNH nuclease domain-containing protein n=1 Tax=Schizothecium vesticola TaxID=314040 RepID=A0AA40F8P9_9PEZI|nr:hypothetical protein B0T18DRAFT_395950 [Schizothecium vesticola]
MADFQWDEDPLAQLGEITPHPVRSPSESSEPLSSAHGSVIAETAKAVANNVLLDYKPIHNSDDTVKVLQAFLDNLSGPGLGTLCNDIYAIKDKQRLLRQLRNFLVDAILKPMAAAGGREPPVTPPPNESAARDIEYAMPTIEGSSRTDHHWLKQQCLDRDGGRCLLTGAIDTDRYGRMAPGERKGARHARTQCAHLLPFALSKLNKRSATHVKNKATIWWALYQYFPALRGKIAANTVNQPGNAVMLSAAIHQDFGLFAFGFRSMEEQHKYHIEILDEDSFYAAQFPTTTTFPQHDPAVPRPDPDILDVHLRIGRILKVSGIGYRVQSSLREYASGEQDIAWDGSTDLGNIIRRKMLIGI